MTRHDAIVLALAFLAAGCTQVRPSRLGVELHRLHPGGIPNTAEQPWEEQVWFDIKVHRDDAVDQLPQIVVAIGESAQIRRGASDDDGAFTGWIADCSVEPDNAFVAWSRFERGAERESGLSVVPVPAR